MTLPCPKCGKLECRIALDFSDGDYLCLDCDATFSAAEVLEAVKLWKQWFPFLEWASKQPAEEAVKTA